jgi:hypothetical protein
MRLVYILPLLFAAILSLDFPKATRYETLGSPITVGEGETFDGHAKNNGQWVAYDRGVKGLGDCKNIEGGSKDPCFILKKGATLKNVILGANSIEHVHCVGDGCTVENVYWEDVCEDALTLKGSTNTGAKFYVKGGGAKNGSDKIIQHNSAGTVIVESFYVENSGKLYRSCGNCKSGYQNRRDVQLKNVQAVNVKVVAGINTNYGDTAKFEKVTFSGGHACQKFTGNNNGAEPSSQGYVDRTDSSWTCDKNSS